MLAFNLGTTNFVILSCARGAEEFLLTHNISG